VWANQEVLRNLPTQSLLFTSICMEGVMAFFAFFQVQGL